MKNGLTSESVWDTYGGRGLLQESFCRLLYKQEGKRATWEYPFAVAGLNISFMLIQMLDLKAGQSLETFSFFHVESPFSGQIISCVIGWS